MENTPTVTVKTTVQRWKKYGPFDLCQSILPNGIMQAMIGTPHLCLMIYEKLANL